MNAPICISFLMIYMIAASMITMTPGFIRINSSILSRGNGNDNNEIIQGVPSPVHITIVPLKTNNGCNV
jgi:hypothetical protein